MTTPKAEQARTLLLLPGPNAAVKAAAVIQIALSHYLVRSADTEQFLAQLRHAVGLKNSG